MKWSINVALVVLLLLPARVFSQNTGRADIFPRLEPDPMAREFFRRGTQTQGFTWEDYAEISLWASGGEAALSYLGHIRAAAAAIQASVQFPADDRARAEFILGYMHRELLRSYSLHQTRVDTLFDNGRVNCVSSSVLYMILCKAAGISVNGVLTRDHAFVSVNVDGEDIDVETTTIYGFDPGNRREFHDQFGRLTGFTYVPARNYRDRQAISPIELVSLILLNRISEHEQGRRFSQAVSLAIDRTTLLLGDTQAVVPAGSSVPFFEQPRENLMGRIHNYSAFLLNSGRDEESLRWTALASPLFPDEERWQELIMGAVNNRITRLTRAGQIAEARNVLDSQRDSLSPANYVALDTLLMETELVNMANAIRSVAEGDNVIAAIEQAQSSGRLNNRQTSRLLTLAARTNASILAAAPGRDWLAAMHYLEGILERFGPNRELEQDLRTYRDNRAADFHNRFAMAWNNRNYTEAERILNEGLAEFPNDRRLLNNRDIVNRNR